MKKFVLSSLFMMICAVTTQAQRCNCTICPYEPSPPCFEICTRSLLATTSLEDLIYILGLKEETAWKIVNMLKASGIRSLAEYSQVLSPEEFQDVMRRANSLNKRQIFHIYRNQSPSQIESMSPGEAAAGAPIGAAGKKADPAIAELVEKAAQDARAAKASESPSLTRSTNKGDWKKDGDAAAYYHYYKDSKGKWRWRLKAANGRILAESAAEYLTEGACLADIKRVKESFAAPVKTE